MKVMQFLSEGRYVAKVVDVKVTLYGRARRDRALRRLSSISPDPSSPKPD
jgi:hypothetical protein